MISIRSKLKSIAVPIILLGVIFAFIGSGQAAFNPEINYQGKLASYATGQAVADGDYDMEFKLYTAPTGGTLLWTETRTGGDQVTVTNGLFSIMLGSVTSLASVNFNQSLYLSVNIEGDGEMTPRKELGAVPAAFEADKLDGLTSADFLSTSTTAAPNLWSLTGLGVIGSSTATTTAAGNLVVSGNASTSVLTVSTLANLGTTTVTNLTVTNLSTSTFAGGLTVGTSQLLVQQATGNIGVGTTSPFAKLSVVPDSGKASFVIASSTNATKADMYIDNRGRTMFGGYSSAMNWNSIALGGNVFNISRDTPTGFGVFNEFAMFHTERAGTGSSYPIWMTSKTNGTLASKSAVADADILWGMFMNGYDGDEYHIAAGMSVVVDGVVADNIMPGRLVFSTNDDIGTGVTERMRIDKYGRVGINTAVTSIDDLTMLTINGTTTASDGYGLKVRDASDANLFVVRNDGFVGIASTTPYYNLSVNGTVGILSTNWATTTIGRTAGDRLVIECTNYFSSCIPTLTSYIGGSENVTAVSNYLAVIGGSTSADPSLYFASEDIVSSGTVDYDATADSLTFGDSDGFDGGVYFNGPGTTTIATNLFVTSGGNVGIATSSQVYKLAVDGPVAFQSDTSWATTTIGQGDAYFEFGALDIAGFKLPKISPLSNLGGTIQGIWDGNLVLREVNGTDSTLSFYSADASIGGSMTYDVATDALNFGSANPFDGGIIFDGSNANVDFNSLVYMQYLADSNDSFGNDGDVLQTNGTSIFWVATSTLGLSGGSNYWTLSGSNLYNNSGTNIGIGTSTPYAKLSVHALDGETNTTLFAIASSTSAATTTHLVVMNDGNVGVSSSTPYAKLSVTNTGANPSFIVEDTTSPDPTQFIIDAGGQVGIGTTTPSGILYLNRTSGNAVMTINNSGDGNTSGINFSRERLSGEGVAGGSIFMQSDTSGNDALLYLQAQTASAGAGTTGDLGAGRGVRLVLRGSGTTGEGAATLDFGRFGISTTTPYANLAVHALYGWSTTTAIFAVSSSTASATTTHFVVRNTGDVGIGVGVPTYRLDIQGTNATQLASRVYNTHASGDAALLFQTTNSTFRWESEGSTENFSLWDESGASTGQRLFVDGSGSFGVGTTTPDSKFNIHANSGETNTKLFSVTSSTASTFSNFLSVSNNGNVAVGTTTSSNNVTLFVQAKNISNTVGIALRSATTSQMAIQSDATGSEHSAQILYRADNGSGAYYAAGVRASSDEFYIYDLGNATQPFTIDYSSGSLVGIASTSPWRTFSVDGTVGFSSSLTAEVGNDNYLCIDPLTYEITNGGTNCGASSEAYKENIQDLEYDLDEVLGMRPVTFQWKEGAYSNTTSTNVGFIAQEMFEIVPEVVEINASGSPASIDYDKLTAVLARAIQQIATITDTFRDNLISWLGNARNGIGDFFANRVRTKQLCLGDASGVETCISKTQLDQLLSDGGVQQATMFVTPTEVISTGSTTSDATTDPAPELTADIIIDLTTEPTADPVEESAPDVVDAPADEPTTDTTPTDAPSSDVPSDSGSATDSAPASDGGSSDPGSGI